MDSNVKNYIETLNARDLTIETLKKNYAEKIEVLHAKGEGLKSQTETIVALRDENDKLRNEKEKWIKTVTYASDRIVELEMQLKSRGKHTDYIKKLEAKIVELEKQIEDVNYQKDMVNKAFGIEKEIQMRKEYGTSIANDKLNQIREILK